MSLSDHFVRHQYMLLCSLTHKHIRPESDVGIRSVPGRQDRGQASQELSLGYGERCRCSSGKPRQVSHNVRQQLVGFEEYHNP